MRGGLFKGVSGRGGMRRISRGGQVTRRVEVDRSDEGNEREH